MLLRMPDMDAALIAQLLDTPAVPATPGEPLTEQHGIAAQHSLHKLAQGMTVETVTVDHMGRETVTTKQLPPNLAAAQAIAAKFDPTWQAGQGQGASGPAQAGITLHITCNGLPLSQFVAKPVIEGEIVPTLPGPD